MRLTHDALFRQHCYVNDQWIAASDLRTFSVYNPFDHTRIGSVPCCSAEQTTQAVLAAHHAWLNWRNTAAATRAALLLRWATRIKQHHADLALLLTTEQGKPLAEAHAEISYAVSFIEWYAAEAMRLHGDLLSTGTQQHGFINKEPIGVVAAITPWNFPCAMITRKCAPALAAGCTVVLKPAEDTPFSALALAALAAEAEFPAGVFNVITGEPAVLGGVLTSHPLVRKLSFTGSTAVGKQLMAQSASTVKKLSLELGGNAPFIVFADADLDQAVAGLMQSKFRNNGQTCICPNRILVEDSIYTAFTQRLLQQMATLRVGNGLVEGIVQGPLINRAAFNKVDGLVQQAIAQGASLHCGGAQHPAGETCYQPTLLTDVTMDMAISQQEIFGPVASLLRFSDEQDAIDTANATEFGLAAYVYTQDQSRIWRITHALQTGMLAINHVALSSATTPFGGIKSSGFGREGSTYGIDEFLQLKYISWQV